jgi:hypothetical protein
MFLSTYCFIKMFLLSLRVSAGQFCKKNTMSQQNEKLPCPPRASAFADSIIFAVIGAMYVQAVNNSPTTL